MVSTVEGKELTGNAATADADDHGWDAAWSDEEDDAAEPGPPDPTPAPEDPAAEDDGTDAWGWNDDEAAPDEPLEEPKEEPKGEQDEEEDPSDAWGWGDEDQKEVPPESALAPAPAPAQPAPREPRTRELVLKETYHISSMPEPVLALIFAIIDDGATLTQSSYELNPVATAAAGLFSLPTLGLAMFRAVSPHYYALDVGGNM